MNWKYEFKLHGNVLVRQKNNCRFFAGTEWQIVFAVLRRKEKRRKIANMFLQPQRVSTGIHIVRREKYSHRFRSRGSNRRLDGWRPPRKFREWDSTWNSKSGIFQPSRRRERTPLDFFLGTDTSAYYWETAERYVKGVADSEEFLNFIRKIPFLRSLARKWR